MNQLIAEIAKVKKMIIRIHPSQKGHYEGMMEWLKVANPLLKTENISENQKRILYLQLVAHSISKSCQKIKKELGAKEIKEVVEEFSLSVASFCRGYVELIKETPEDVIFEQNQVFASQLFMSKWSYLTTFLTEHLNE